MAIGGLVLILALVSGLYLLVSGLRGRRIGDEPRCANCGYILLHLESCHCPECGTEIAAYNTVIGQRHRRPGRVIAGVVLLLLTCLPMVSPVVRAVENIPWYQYKPAGYVVDDVDIPATYSKAMKELQRREKVGSLSGSAQQKLIEKALQEQAAKTTNRRELLDYLGMALVGGRLAQEQKDRFLDQACALSMTIRPIVAEGDQVPFFIWQEGRGPEGEYPGVFWSELYSSALRVDGKMVRAGHGVSAGGLTGRVGMGSSVPAGEVGKHMLENDMALSIWYGQAHKQVESQLLGKRTFTVSGSYEVLSRDQAPKIELLDSEELRTQVLAAVKLERLVLQKGGYLDATFRFSIAPCGLAFNVFVVTEKEERKAGSINCAKGKSTDCGTSVQNFQDKSAKVKVILRPSEEVARQTVDLTAIYSGDVVFDDVVVERVNY